MNTTTHLARHMLAFEPQKDPTRLSFYHYLIHHCPPDTPLSPKIMENFCRKALTFSHWRKSKEDLSQELQYILQHYSQTYGLHWNLKDLVLPDRWQILKVENKVDAIYIFEKWLDRNFKNHKTKIFYTKKKHFVILIQNEKKEICVLESPGLMLLQRGEIEPLCTDLVLSYDNQLELKQEVTQHLSAGPHTSVRFQVQGDSIKGLALGGFIFRKQQEIRGKIHQFPIVFYPLKVLEQYFIERKSDPSYQELVQVMEKSLELIHLKHPEAQSFARAALNRGQSALDNIFHQDSVMEVLIHDIRKELIES